ncbi:MAG: hypothetical protein PHV93_04535 [Candidatus Pacebacteria bacterium]|nr:hypothetical protein [Candidatus Paceibacterota bacterium]
MTDKICTGAEYTTGKITRRGKCVNCGFCNRKNKLVALTVEFNSGRRNKIVRRVNEIAARGKAEVELRPDYPGTVV